MRAQRLRCAILGRVKTNIAASMTLADVAPESVLLAGAGRAILLQLAHPAVGHGVARHSNFVNDPLKRFHGTLAYIYALSNGTADQRKTVQKQVQRAHLPVKAAASGHVPAYNAADPQLQLWVAATLYESACQTYDVVFPALAVYWEEQLAQLYVDDTVRAVAAELLAARNAPWWIRAAMPLARFLTAGMLPPDVRQMYALPWSPRSDRLLGLFFRGATKLVPLVPAKVRHAPMHYYLKRIPG